jgi:hypothetical protein
MLHGRLADPLAEPEGEGRARHAGDRRQFLDRPWARRVGVDGPDRRADLPVGQGEEPADAVHAAGVALRPQRLHQHRVGPA